MHNLKQNPRSMVGFDYFQLIETNAKIGHNHSLSQSSAGNHGKDRAQFNSVILF